MSGSGPIGIEDAEYTWEALAEVLNALVNVEASTQRQLIDQISAQVSEAGNDVIHFIQEQATIAMHRGRYPSGTPARGKPRP
jgi:hypothetical protein